MVAKGSIWLPSGPPRRTPPHPGPRHAGPACPHTALAPALAPQADSLEEVEAQLVRRGVPFVRQAVVEEGIKVQQLFFHDPDNNMIEVGRGGGCAQEWGAKRPHAWACTRREAAGRAPRLRVGRRRRRCWHVPAASSGR